MKSTIFMLIGFLAFISCNESSEQMMDPQLVIEAPDNEMEINEILSGTSSRAWQSESFQLEVFGSLECRSDDVFTFFSDGTYEYDGGETLCGDSDNQQIVTGTWEVDLEAKQFVFNKDTDAQEIANYITVTDDLIRVMGSWNSLGIDAIFIRK